MPHRSLRRRSLLAAAAILSILAGSAGTSLARSTSSPTTDATFTGGSWVLYLHNRPTPPVGNTTAQFALAMDATVPTVGSLNNYDTDCDSQAGRLIQSGGGLSSEATLCNYANWQTAAYGANRALNGTITLRIYAAKTGVITNTTLIAFLRDFNPSTSGYTDLGSQSVVVNTSTQTQFTLTWSLNTSIPAGHKLELKMVATGTLTNAILAYDTSAEQSRLVLLQIPAT
jgi:hypothetical protein